MMMLEVLDEPTAARLVIETTYPDFNPECGHNGHAYFMVDRGECGSPDRPAAIYDQWRVTDSIGQSTIFNDNNELIEFVESIGDLITDAYVDAF